MGGCSSSTEATSYSLDHSNDVPSTKVSRKTLKRKPSVLQLMQKNMAKNHDEMKREIGKVRNDTGELKNKIQKMDEKFENFQPLITKNEQKIQEIEERMEKEEKIVDGINDRLIQTNKKLETTVIFLESEKAAHYLRFQNMEEEKGEDLPDVMAELLAKALGKEKEELLTEIDEIYRIHMNYARKHKLPKEVHVRFVKKWMRDEVFNKARDEPIHYKEKQLIVLKQVPRRVRELRKQYQFLTMLLTRYNVNFRWLTPEGILVAWCEKRYRLDSLDKAMEFYNHHFGTEVELEEREALEDRDQGMPAIEEKELQQKEKEKEGGKRLNREQRNKTQRTERNKSNQQCKT